jgi:hypothetical protein
MSSAVDHRDSGAGPERRPFQYRLRTLLLAVLVFGVLCSFIKWFGATFFLRLFELAVYECPFGGAVVPAVFALLCGAVGWTLVRRLDLSVRLSATSVLTIVLLVSATTACVYAGWARYRVVYQMPDVCLGREWPYPDGAVMQLYRWLDARNPLGTFKYHGEWLGVRFAMDGIVFLLAGIGGGCLGLTVPRFLPRGRLREMFGKKWSRFAPGRRTRFGVGLVLVALAGWLLVKMERTRRQWQDATEWAEKGASAYYRNHRLVGLQFNTLTLSMHYFGNEQFGDDDLVQLRELTDLEDLGLTDTQVTDAGLVHLTGLTKLECLDLDGTQVTDAGLDCLTGFAEIWRLELDETRIGDAGLKQIEGMTQLRVLTLEGTRVTDAGLVHLKGLINLTYLDLSKTAVTDAGLRHLEGLPELRSLSLENTQVTDKGARRLRRTLPHTCTINR